MLGSRLERMGYRSREESRHSPRFRRMLAHGRSQTESRAHVQLRT
jgi:hypothetical protein